MSTQYLPDDDVDDICAGLKQNAAKVRFLERLGFKVRQKPNGRPLVSRDDPANKGKAATMATANEPNWTRLA